LEKARVNPRRLWKLCPISSCSN